MTDNLIKRLTAGATGVGNLPKDLYRKDCADALAEIERLRKGIQDYLDGNFGPRIGKNDKCPHGLYGYEDCGRCIDDHFSAIIGHQQSGSKE